jgi:hypothetical protein
MPKPSFACRLTLGPLCYELRGHDSWAVHTMGHLEEQVECVGSCVSAERIVHLLDIGTSADVMSAARDGCLPPELATYLPEDSPLHGWRVADDATGSTSWYHPQSQHAAWTHGPAQARMSARFQLPWHVILEDLVARGGALMHTALLSRSGAGYLLTAPPGGGKTTAVSRIPPPWEVLSDDAALVWPRDEGTWMASGMPTWGGMLGQRAQIPRIGRWRPAESCKLRALAVLVKSERLSLTGLAPVQAAAYVYRALCEHPRVVGMRHQYRAHLFHTAAQLARSLTAWQLRLGREDPFWNMLPDMAKSSD